MDVSKQQMLTAIKAYLEEEFYIDVSTDSPDVQLESLADHLAGYLNDEVNP